MEDKARARWEPPPWEADAFEALKRKKDERAADEEISEAIAGLGAPGEPDVTEDAGAPAAEPPPVAPGESVTPAADERRASAARVEAMMIGLRAEEPKGVGRTWVIGAVAAAVMLLLGLALLVVGLSALASPGARTTAGLLAASIIVLFGGTCLGMGAWLVQRTLEAKGGH